MNTKQMSAIESAAHERVMQSDALAPHAAFILADWPEGADHFEWVYEASEEDILEWIAASK